MDQTWQGNSDLPAPVREGLERFCSRLEDALGEALVSILLYGGLAKNEPYDPRTSDVNVMVLLNEVTVERNAEVGKVDAEARAAVLAAGSKIVELDDAQRQAWVDAMKPVWEQFKDDVGQDNIDAAQAINAGF